MRSNTAAYPRGRSIIMVPVFVLLATFFVAGTHFEGLKLIDEFNPSHHVEATEEPLSSPPLLTGEEFNRAMAAELGKVSESESARRAFNTLASLWKVQPLSESGNFNKPNAMERAASGRNLRLYRFFGNLGALIRMGYPAALELNLPGIPGKRFVSLVGMEEEKLVIDPPIAGRKSLTFGELERNWSGHAFLLWKDPLNLLPNVSPGSRGSHVKQLQGLLQEARAYNGPLTGIYDRDTVSAVKEFQSLRGIEQDGIVGGQTLMLVYRSIDRFEIPKLTAGQK